MLYNLTHTNTALLKDFYLVAYSLNPFLGNVIKIALRVYDLNVAFIYSTIFVLTY